MDLSRPVSVGHINYAGSVPGEWQATVYVSLPALRPPTTQLRLLSTPLYTNFLLILLVSCYFCSFNTNKPTYIYHFHFVICLSLPPLRHFLCPGPSVLNGPQLIGWATPSSSFVLNYMTAYMKGGDGGGCRGVSTSGPPSLSNRLIKFVWEKVP